MDEKEWQEWLKEHMTPERIVLYREHAQEDVRNWAQRGGKRVVHWCAVTSGSSIDWPTAGSPLPPGGIPEAKAISEGLKRYYDADNIMCWYCGGPNPPDAPTCQYCKAPQSG